MRILASACVVEDLSPTTARWAADSLLFAYFFAAMVGFEMPAVTSAWGSSAGPNKQRIRSMFGVGPLVGSLRLRGGQEMQLAPTFDLSDRVREIKKYVECMSHELCV